MQFLKQVAKEFKEFAVKGNVVDLAVGVIIGSAFGKVVSSLVNDIIMPPIGVVLHGINFMNLKVILQKGEEGTSDVVLSYGQFVQNILEFVIIAFAVFLMVKGMNKLRRKKEAEPAPQPVQLTKQEQLLTEIRDILRK